MVCLLVSMVPCLIRNSAISWYACSIKCVIDRAYCDRYAIGMMLDPALFPMLMSILLECQICMHCHNRLVQKDAHVRRTCVGVQPSYTSSRSPLSRNKWCCLPSVRSISSGSWHIACAASRQHMTWPRPSSHEYCLGAATSACSQESKCLSMHNYKPIIVRRQK